MEPGPSRPELIYKNLPLPLRLSLEDRRILKTFAQDLLVLTGGRLFTCLFADDATLRKLHRQFLEHDYATDVLSFPSGAGTQLGDLAISLERAQEQALAYAHTTIDESRILMLHGVLHLIGFDHEHDEGEMAREERKWRKKLGLPRTLIARNRESRRSKQTPRAVEGIAP